MPRALPNPALVVDDPAPLERNVGFPHAIQPFPVDRLLESARFDRLPPAPAAPPRPGLPTPAEPESAL